MNDAQQSARFAVRLIPRAGRDAIGVLEGETLRVRVAAAPVGGAANEALVKLLAKRLRVGRQAVRIVRGATSVHKQIEVEGLTTIVALERLAGARAEDAKP